MNYRIHFTHGEPLLIDGRIVDIIVEALGSPIIVFDDNDKKRLVIYPQHILYITPEEEAATGIASSPTPDDIKLQRKEESEAIKANPDAILKRAASQFDKK